jgi:hypothetical protein
VERKSATISRRLPPSSRSCRYDFEDRTLNPPLTTEPAVRHPLTRSSHGAYLGDRFEYYRTFCVNTYCRSAYHTIANRHHRTIHNTNRFIRGGHQIVSFSALEPRGCQIDALAATVCLLQLRTCRLATDRYRNCRTTPVVTVMTICIPNLQIAAPPFSKHGSELRLASRGGVAMPRRPESAESAGQRVKLITYLP